MKIKHQKLKSAGAFLTILLLLPYVVTVFVNGIDVLGMSQEPCVQAETEDQDGEKTVRTVPWTEYMMGILGKTMPASYEKEALKAQAVVLRTMLYQQAAQDVVFKEAYLTPEELKKKWGAENFENYYKKLREVLDETQEKDSAGYVSKFRIGNTVCSGDEFRDALSLASSAFSIQEESGGLKITTMGKGHGLGMSQWTANELAKNGQNYKEILEFFFEGTTITNSSASGKNIARGDEYE